MKLPSQENHLLAVDRDSPSSISPWLRCSQNDEALLHRRLHSLVEDQSGSKPEVVRPCAAVLREIARHKACGFFLFPIDETQVHAFHAGTLFRPFWQRTSKILAIYPLRKKKWTSRYDFPCRIVPRMRWRNKYPASVVTAYLVTGNR